MKKEITSGKVGSAPTFSQAVEANGIVFVAGQIHADKEWKLIGETVKEKLDSIFENIRQILEAANLTLDNIASVTVYVTDIAQMPEINQYYPSYFSGVMPARVAVCVKELPLGATIELSVIAARQ